MNIRQQIYGETGLQESPLVFVKNPKGAKANMLHSIPVARAESRNGDTRHQDRYRIVDEAARVSHCGATYDAQLINICGSGAMVSAEFEPVPWDRVALHLGDHPPVDSTVLWVKGGRVGLEFTQSIGLDRADSECATPIREMIMSRFPDARFEPAVEPEEPAAQPITEEQRLERRNPLIRMGTVHYDYQSTPARLRNISSMGATIETSAALAQGAEPLLDLGDAGSVFGTVVWKKGDQAGLRFNQPFDLSQLPKARSNGGTGSWEPPAYLRNNTHCDSRWEDQNHGSLTEINEDFDGFLKR